ncbi:MAG: AAA family ATPase [Dehalococcoidia bacterium]|nr:AAA family ATPase [Dehalococcoidia bacterium]
MFRRITDDMDALLERLPPHIAHPLQEREDRSELLEVVMDLGRPPKARYPEGEIVLSEKEATEEDIEYIVSRIAAFGGDNRAGIERTLHRISAIRNREGRIIGLTCRVGRAVYGTIGIIEDLIKSGRSILLLGGPGVGKTTMLREVARVLADDLKKRVVVVDTSNEIAGDGDIPHPAIGHARRMQVPTPQLQHAVMIEAVENHMPEVIVIDEIGTELEAQAARTIAERGVQLVATAHGNTLENLIMNPTLADLIGGIQTVTLGDEEAKRRGTQKSILERKAPPTFDIVVEIQDWYHVAVHSDVAGVVDALLRGRPVPPEVRWLDETDEVRREQMAPRQVGEKPGARKGLAGRPTKIMPFGINRSRLEQAVKGMGLPAKVVVDLGEANLLMTSKSYYRRKPQPIRDAETAGIPIYVLKGNKVSQMERCLANLFDVEAPEDPFSFAIKEAEEAIAQVMEGKGAVELSPQNSYLRMLQHQLAERYSLSSQSTGREPRRRVRIFKGEEG